MNPYSTEQTVTALDEKIKQLSSAQSDYSSMSICRVNRHLVPNANPKAYEPEIVAIGPYHRHVHGDHLQIMEDRKVLYLDLLLKRKNMQSAAEFVAAIERVESQARKCYAELPINLDKTEFVQMLVLDGCFIIQLVRKSDMAKLRETNDPIFQMDWIIRSLKRDLLLFENQVPYFVLCELFDLIEAPGQRSRLAKLLKHFFENLCPINLNTEVAGNEIKHILGLIRHFWIPPKFKVGRESEESEENEEGEESEESEESEENEEGEEGEESEENEEGEESEESEDGLQFIKSATRLSEANVCFVRNKFAQLLDIKFEDGVMKMAPLTVEDRTESLFRNLIAYEQYCYCDEFRYVSHYVKFLDCLIDSSKDVELLSRYKIIDNQLGDDDAVSKMVNSLNDSVARTGFWFIYDEIFKKVNKHCEYPINKCVAKVRNRINEWMEKLREDYFYSPWSIISVVAAIVLLLLTVAQTVVTLLQVVSP